jgi:signal transduction histidine kinase/CheY-like chemotaxis protein
MPDSGQPRNDGKGAAAGRRPPDEPPPDAPPPDDPPARAPGAIGLPTRLLALVLLCLLPVVVVEIGANIDLRARRQAELRDLAMRQSELATSDMASLVDGAGRLMLALARLPAVRAAAPNCDADLGALKQRMPEYAFLAVLGADGRVLCSSSPGASAAGTRMAWAEGVPQSGDVVIGRYTPIPGSAAVLPIMQTDSGHTFVAALDLAWLGRHLAGLWRSRTPLQADSTVAVTDWDGRVLAGYPDRPGWLGKLLPEAVLRLVDAGEPGTAAVRLADDEGRLAAYMPTTVPPIGLATIVFVASQSSAAWFDLSGAREIALAAGAALLALGLTMLAARRFFRRPMARLLRAARHWRDGDLGARADVGQADSDFGGLAADLNQMAAALQRRDAALRQQADMLQAQVDARTRALSEINNRLQVEIADRARTEAALHQAQKLQAVGQLAGGIAHDFNNMLATILGSLELMERRIQTGALGADPEEVSRQETLIARASQAVQRGAQLTSRLLAFSRRQRLDVRPTDLNRLIGDLVGLAAGTLGRSITVRTDLAPDPWAALADPSQVEAAILNLCLNARDAMPRGGELLIATGHDSVTDAAAAGVPPGDYVRVTVSDTGAGMTSDVQARAFEPFFTTKGPAGTGLGLSQVHRVARQSGGTVRIASAPGAGTTVTLLLRRAPAAAQDPPKDRAAAAALLAGLRVLVVDDDAAVRRVTVDMLHDLRCDVVEASCAAQALALLDGPARTVDLQLIDYLMPEMNGMELARAIRARGIATPIVLATGYAELHEAADGHAALPDARLNKPFTITELRTVLLRLRPPPTNRNV